MRSSLTRRLLILYAATVLIIVGVAGGLVWVLMHRALHAALDETLQTEARALASRLEFDRGRLEFEAGAPHSDNPNLEPAEPLGQIVDDSGETVFTSSVLKNERIFTGRLPATPLGENLIWLTKPLPPHGDLARVLALHVIARSDEEETMATTAPAARGAWVIVARSLAPLSRTLGQLASVLAAAAGAAALAALAGGFIVSRRGARPVRALAESIGHVNPEAPELKIDRQRVPVELEPMVATMERLLERIRGELARQRRLTADVAHDLRTPVAGVRTLLDVCVQRDRTALEYVATIDKARAALRQLSQLLDDVLTLSRLDAGADQPVWANIPLEEVLAAAIATVQPLAAAREINLQAAACPPVNIRTDRGKLAKILSNLLSNAVEHSPPGAVVRLTARIDGEKLEVAIEDHGPGISTELRSRIFDRFVRGDTARTGGDGHYGLGLPIVAGLAQILGGTVTLDENYELGSRFVVQLPFT